MLTRDWYVIHDSDPELQGKGAMRIHPREAADLNSAGYGIFWTVQEFRGARRIENLARINSWAIETDEGDKVDQLQNIMRFCYPSLVVETKRGFHVYWNAREARPENYQAIVLDRLCHHLKGDVRARDLARVLRVPGYYHMKDPADPFPVKTIWENPVTYSEEQMFYNFPLPPEKIIESKAKQQVRRAFAVEGDDFWEKVYNLDGVMALDRVSGTPAVCGESYTFRRVASGNQNIIVNGKGTSCFVDDKGRIGSAAGGGPSIYQWLNWYHRDSKKTYGFIKEFFPELFK